MSLTALKQSFYNKHQSLWTKKPIYSGLLLNDIWSQSFVTAFNCIQPWQAIKLNVQKNWETSK